MKSSLKKAISGTQITKNANTVASTDIDILTIGAEPVKATYGVGFNTELDPESEPEPPEPNPGPEVEPGPKLEREPVPGPDLEPELLGSGEDEM